MRYEYGIALLFLWILLPYTSLRLSNGLFELVHFLSEFSLTCHLLLVFFERSTRFNQCIWWMIPRGPSFIPYKNFWVSWKRIGYGWASWNYRDHRIFMQRWTNLLQQPTSYFEKIMRKLSPKNNVSDISADERILTSQTQALPCLHFVRRKYTEVIEDALVLFVYR